MSTVTFQKISFYTTRNIIIEMSVYAHMGRIFIAFVAQKAVQTFKNNRLNVKQEQSVFERTFGFCNTFSQTMVLLEVLIKHSLSFVLFRAFF